jgi:hypothetical protein
MVINIIMKHQLTGTMLYLVLTNNLQSITYLTFKQNGDEVYWKTINLLYKFRFRSSKNSIISSLLIIKDQINIFNG